MAVTELGTADVLRHRVAAQQLMRPPDPARALTDAAVLDAVRPLRQAGLGAQEGLTEVATAMRAIVTATRDKAMAKGELSGRLRAALPEPYLRSCVPCGAVHPYEMTFRLAALRAGLELDPGSSPPVLRRVPRWPVRSLAAPDPDAAPEHLDVVRAGRAPRGPAGGLRPVPPVPGPGPPRAGGRPAPGPLALDRTSGCRAGCPTEPTAGWPPRSTRPANSSPGTAVSPSRGSPPGEPAGRASLACGDGRRTHPVADAPRQGRRLRAGPA